MGVNIYLRGFGDISPGWNKDMARWLIEIQRADAQPEWSGDRDDLPPLRLTSEDIPALERRRDTQLRGDPNTPEDYQTSEHWTRCFNIIIDTIRASGEALVELHW
jgi:hypothetical protein